MKLESTEGRKMPGELHDRSGTAFAPSLEAKIDPLGLLNLFFVYVVYGSTYLAIRVAVRPGAGFPPFTLGLLRIMLAGTLTLTWGALRRQRMRPTREEFWVLLGSGLLFWTVANGLVNWAEQRADSGLAALIIASTPIWTAFIESLLDRRAPSILLSLALAVGFGGIALLSAPSLRSGTRVDMISVLALLGASCSWAIGSVLQGRRKIALAPQVSSGYQQLFGGLGFVFTTLFAREPMPTPTPEAWLAWGYLVIMGSVLGFTAFVQILRLLPTSVAMTYAYVNPVIAVILGALILRESITLWTVGGAVLVLLGVAGVFRDRYNGTKNAAREADNPRRLGKQSDPE